MMWSDQATKALRKWLGVSTWHTNHAFDMGRFFIFVASVWNDNHALWDESAAREVITDEAKALYPNGNDLVAEVIERRVTEGTTVLEFLSSIRADQRLDLITQD